MKTIMILTIAALALLPAGCDGGPKSTRRVQLPQGNAEKGRTAFIALNCTKCHRIAGVELPPPKVDAASVVVLGGEVARVRTYGDLLTAIIHPGLADTVPQRTPDGAKERTKMPVVNDVMTVAEMVDLVTFLQPHYRALPPPPGSYFEL